MPVFRKDGKNVLFVHIPKTGGSSIRTIFERSGYEVLYRDTSSGPLSANRLRRCSPQHMHAEMLRAIFRVTAFDVVFMFTRDPVSRFRSEYGMRNPADTGPTPSAVEAWADRVFRRYRQDPFMLDNHLRPQSEFLLEGSQVYPIEGGMPAALQDLNERFELELDPRVPHVMNRERASGFRSSDVPVSLDLRHRLEDFYREDYAEFGYQIV